MTDALTDNAGIRLKTFWQLKKDHCVKLVIIDNNRNIFIFHNWINKLLSRSPQDTVWSWKGGKHKKTVLRPVCLFSCENEDISKQSVTTVSFLIIIPSLKLHNAPSRIISFLSSFHSSLLYCRQRQQTVHRHLNEWQAQTINLTVSRSLLITSVSRAVQHNLPVRLILMAPGSIMQIPDKDWQL